MSRAFWHGRMPLVALLAGALLLSTALFASASTQSAQAAAAVSASNGWQIVPGPSVGMNDALAGIAQVSADELWAVGAYYTSTPQYHQVTLTHHYVDGQWQAVASPNASDFQNELKAVSAVSAADVWAVGDAYDAKSGLTQGLIEHWNGSVWKVVRSPELPGAATRAQASSGPIPYGVPAGAVLRAVAARTASDAWAVGHFYDASGQLQALIEHWDGKAWSVMPSPAPAGANLGGVTALSADDAWAVGDDGAGPLAMHWNGAVWELSATPILAPTDVATGGGGGGGGQPGAFAAVSARGPSDVWAAGFYLDTSANLTRTLAEHWDGHNWTIVRSPSVPTADNFFNGIAQGGDGALWAVGNSHTPTGFDRTLIERQTPGTWVVTQSPNASSEDNQLFGVVVTDAGTVWAVGTYSSTLDGQQHALIERNG